jgi:4-azaleucine resistance transporter AzlC
MIAEPRTTIAQQTSQSTDNVTFRAQLRRGFLGPVPLWPGDIPFGIAYALVAGTSGFSGGETLLSSLLVYAGSAQLVMVTMYGGGAGLLSIVVTAAILNMRHILYALSLNRWLRADERPGRSALAPLLTDEAYGLTMREYLAGRGSAAYLLGAGVSLYLMWVTATLTGVLFGSLLPDPERIGMEFIFPLSFLALLLPLLRSRVAVIVAIVAAATALAVEPYASSGVTFLSAAISGAALGALLNRGDSVRLASEEES